MILVDRGRNLELQNESSKFRPLFPMLRSLCEQSLGLDGVIRVGMGIPFCGPDSEVLEETESFTRKTGFGRLGKDIRKGQRHFPFGRGSLSKNAEPVSQALYGLSIQVLLVYGERGFVNVVSQKQQSNPGYPIV